MLSLKCETILQLHENSISIPRIVIFGAANWDEQYVLQEKCIIKHQILDGNQRISHSSITGDFPNKRAIIIKPNRKWTLDQPQ